MNKLKLKLIVWHGAVLVLSWEFWRYLSYLFNNSSKPDFEPVGVINFIVLSSVLALGLMLFRRKWHALSFGATHGLFYLVYFGFNAINLLGVAILAGLLFLSRLSINSELNERFKINSKTILRRGLMSVVLGIFVLISFAAYQSPLAKEIESSKKLPSGTEVFIRDIVANTIGSRVDTVNEAEKQNIISQITNETFGEINTFLKPYFQYAPPFLAFGLFLILWGLSWIFIWLSVLLGMLIFWILKKTKFVKMEKYSVEAEKLTV